MNFPEAEAYLYSLGNEVEAMKLGLVNIRKLLAALGDPQKSYLKVQVAGTNGKGSVCAFLDSICLQSGIKTGVFTSPHLVSITERVRINGNDISEDDFARLATRVREVSESLVKQGEMENVPTYFEQITAIALVAFAEANVELAILETGLGGRYDAVTAANAEIAAITRIDLDHQQYLGETIEEIAAEKAAIIRADSRVVIGEQNDSAMKVILDRCRDVGVVESFRTNQGSYDDPNLGLKGRHQLENARIAVMVSELLANNCGFAISADNVVEGLENPRHPGRLEHIGNFLLDGAHNSGGAKALVAFLDEFVTQPITLVFGAMRDKDVNEIATAIFPKVENIVLFEIANSPAMPTVEILRVIDRNLWDCKPVTVANSANVIELSETMSEPGGIILVTGSLYLVGEVKKLLNN